MHFQLPKTEKKSKISKFSLNFIAQKKIEWK